MVESHTKQQILETVSETELRAKRSKFAVSGARTRESAMVIFFWVNGVMWEEVSDGGHIGTTTHQGMPGGPVTPRWVVPTWCTPL